MPKEMTPTEFRKDLYRLLDQILESGVPLEIRRKGKKLRIEPVLPRRDVRALPGHPGTIPGDPEELVHLDWSSSWAPEL
jgi:hypothetical protein